MRKACWFLLGLPVMGIQACGESGTGSCRGEDRYQVPCQGEDLTFQVGPYLGHTTRNSAAIGWETAEAGDSRLEYGRDQTYGQVVQGEPGTMHRVQLDGLKSGTHYHYRACTDERCTSDLVFATAPDPNRPVRFAVYGDCQDNPPIHRQVIEQVKQDAATLVLVVGDTVSDGSIREQFKERFFDPARSLAHCVPRYAAVGNHDRKDVEAVHFRDYHIFPEDPDVPQAETSYSFVYQDAFFLVFDNTLDHYDLFFPPVEGLDPPLWLWLQQQARSPLAQNARWRFAFAHYPADSNCYEDGHSYGLPESAVRKYVLPLLWENAFHAYFAGHMHCYERFDFDGHLVITSGGGGGGLEPEERCDNGLPEARRHACVHHHTAVELGCEQAQVWARDLEGNIIERITLHENGQYEVVP